MLVFPEIDPVAIHIGTIPVYWYGIAYAAGLLFGLGYTKILLQNYRLPLESKVLDDFCLVFIIGMIIGGRIGYVVIYDFTRYISNPLEILAIRDGGMSFHGALIGIGIAMWLFSRKRKINFFLLSDLVAIVAPIGIFFGRIANFVNGELYGRQTEAFWGVLFPDDTISRHPSQIYEASLEGIVLFFIMLVSSKRLDCRGYNTGIFLIFYSIFRMVCEYFREPDIQLGFVLGPLSMGQLLSIPLFLVGLSILVVSKKCQSSQKSEC